MTCASAQKQLVLYLARELSEDASERVACHLERCARCAREAEALDETQDRLEQVLRTDREPSTRMDARVMEAVRGMAPGRRVSTVRRRMALFAVAACAVFAIVTIGRLGIREPVRQPLDGRVLDAAYRFEAARDEPVWPPASTDGLLRHLSLEARFAVRVVSEEEAGAKLLHGHALLAGRTQLAALRYDWEGRPLILFQADAGRTSLMQAGTAQFRGETYRIGARNGVGFVAWRSGTVNCVLMSRASPAKLLPLAGEFCEAMERS